MKPYSNFLTAIQRQTESNCCWWVFYTLGNLATPQLLTTPEYQSYNLLQQFILMLFASNSGIYKLFARFTYQESALIATGISYTAAKKD